MAKVAPRAANLGKSGELRRILSLPYARKQRSLTQRILDCSKKPTGKLQ